jgi:hypothetical protein
LKFEFSNFGVKWLPFLSTSKLGFEDSQRIKGIKGFSNTIPTINLQQYFTK